jgi:hypothetical protein
MVVARLDEERGGDVDGVAPRSARSVDSVCDEGSRTRIRVVLTASRVRPQDGVLDAGVGICTSASQVRQLRLAGGQALAPGGTLRSGFENKVATVRVVGESPHGEISVSTTLGALFDTQESSLIPVTPGTIPLPLDGKPDSYPFDWFSFSGYAELELPPPVEVPSSMKMKDANPDHHVLDAGLHLLTAPKVGDFRIRRELSFRPAPIGPNLIMGITRERSTQRFVIMVLCVPVLFAALFFTLVLRSHRDGAQGLRDLLIGMIGATVALLPIRQVLVPDDIDGLTIVDWWLGSVILLFLAVALWALPVAFHEPGRVSIVSRFPKRSLGIAGIAGGLLFLGWIVWPSPRTDLADYVPSSWQCGEDASREESAASLECDNAAGPDAETRLEGFHSKSELNDAYQYLVFEDDSRYPCPVELSRLMDGWLLGDADCDSISVERNGISGRDMRVYWTDPDERVLVEMEAPPDVDPRQLIREAEALRERAGLFNGRLAP